MKLIFLTLIILSFSLNAVVLERKINGIVVDSTGLQWQDNEESKTLVLDWIGAVNYCEGLNLGGFNDWRLPNINENKTLIYRENGDNIFIIGFLNISYYNYWSSTTSAGERGWAWILEARYGKIFTENKYQKNHVRCVRAGE